MAFVFPLKLKFFISTCVSTNKYDEFANSFKCFIKKKFQNQLVKNHKPLKLPSE